MTVKINGKETLDKVGKVVQLLNTVEETECVIKKLREEALEYDLGFEPECESRLAAEISYLEDSLDYIKHWIYKYGIDIKVNE